MPPGRFLLAGRTGGHARRVPDAKAVATNDDVTTRLVRGGYPEAIQRVAADRRSAWFAAYLSTILQRDVRDAGLAHTTLTRYLALLETFVVGELRKQLSCWGGNQGQRHRWNN
jgi:hypothetical protein